MMTFQRSPEFSLYSDKTTSVTRLISAYADNDIILKFDLYKMSEFSSEFTIEPSKITEYWMTLSYSNGITFHIARGEDLAAAEQPGND